MFQTLLIFMKLFFLTQNERDKELAATIALLKHENLILKKRLKQKKKRILFTFFEKLKLALLAKFSKKSFSFLTIVTPQTVLRWVKEFTKSFWRFGNTKKNPGRPRISKEHREQILSMKNDNLLWGARRIEGELLKLGIEIDQSTIKRILHEYRRKGKIKSGITWKKFLRSHADSLFAMDFATVTSIFGQTYYIHFFISHKDRTIVHFNITKHPTHLFVKNQLNQFTYDRDYQKIYLIHDGDYNFTGINYDIWKIKSVRTSWKSPNMNTIAERFIRSLRQESLNNFIIFNGDQLRRIVKEYVTYYNTQRPHQGIAQEIPEGYTPQINGKIISEPVVSGLHHHYTRKAS